jgi:cobalt-zinc-cadmium efflux system protein
MSRQRRLGVVFALNGALILGFVIVGIASHSLGVLAASGDYAADAVAIGLSMFTIRLSRRAPTSKLSFGYHRSTVLAAQLNASLIVAISAVVGFEAIRRLLGASPRVQGLPVVVISGVAALVMVIGALVLRADHDDDLNMRAVLLDTAADAVTAAGVALSGVVILATGRFFWLDAAVALVIAAVIAYRALRLLREVGDVLLESTPKGLDVAEIESVLCEGGEIEEVHDLHAWSLTSDVALLSAHVVLAGHPTLEEAQTVGERAKRRLVERFGIEHATLEMECDVCLSPDVHSRWTSG